MTTGTPAPIEARRLHPMTLVQRLLVSIPGLAVLLLPVLRRPDADAWVSLMTAALYAFFVVPMLFVQYRRFRYAVTPKEISIESGVFTRQHRSIPIERIQNIEIEQRLLQRLFGTAKVRIETAGSTTTEGVLEYVGLDEAYHIREVVRAFQQAAAPEAAPLPEDAAESLAAASAAPSTAAPEPQTILYEMSLERTVLSGAFRFSLLYIALIFSAMEYTGLDVEEVVEWMARGRMRGVAEFATASPWLTAFLTIAVVLLFAWLTGIAMNVNRYYGFRLWLEDGKLHKRHGLLTLSEGTIPLKKVQALLLRTNPLMRAFGWYRLELQTMGLDAEQQGRHPVAVPFAQLDEVLAVARHVRPFTLPDGFTPVSPRTVRRHFVRYVVRLLGIVLPLAYFWRPALWALAAAPALWYLAVLQYRHHGYAFRDGFLFVRRGVFQPHLWVTPADRFEVFYLTGSLFQRRLGLRSLNIDTPGAGSFRYPIIVDLPDGEAEARLQEWYGAFQAAGGIQPDPAPQPESP